jgi:hypothetical protein
MVRNYGVMGGLLLVGVLLLGMPNPCSAALFGKSTFSDVGDALRDADHARERYHQHRSGRDSNRYEREWIDRESKLEDVRIHRMSKEAKTPARDVRKMRENGSSWKDISHRYRVDAHKMGCDHKGPHGYDRDHDRDLYRHLYKKHGKGH